MPESFFLNKIEGRGFPTNTPRVFHVEMKWKRFSVNYTWCICWVVTLLKRGSGTGVFL